MLKYSVDQLLILVLSISFIDCACRNSSQTIQMNSYIKIQHSLFQPLHIHPISVYYSPVVFLSGCPPSKMCSASSSDTLLHEVPMQNPISLLRCSSFASSRSAQRTWGTNAYSSKWSIITRVCCQHLQLLTLDNPL